MTTRSLSIAAPFLSRNQTVAVPRVATTATSGGSFFGRLAQVREMLAERLSLPHQLELRFLRAARQGRPVVLGSIDRPFLARGSVFRTETSFSPLEVLREFEGLQVELIAKPEDILPHKQLLARLDRQHAVTIDLILPEVDLRQPEVREALRTVRALTDLGLAVRAVMQGAPSVPTLEMSRRLFQKARKMGAFDVRWAAEGEAAPAEETEELCRRLRLEYGFPRAVVGRG